MHRRLRFAWVWLLIFLSSACQPHSPLPAPIVASLPPTALVSPPAQPSPAPQSSSPEPPRELAALYVHNGMLYSWYARQARAIERSEACGGINLSDDGQWIIHRQNQEIWMVTRDGQERKLLLTIAGLKGSLPSSLKSGLVFDRIQWIAGTHQLLVSAGYNGGTPNPDENSPSFLFQIDGDTGNWALLLERTGGFNYFPVVSPDGQELAVRDSPAVYRLPADGSRPKQVIFDAGKQVNSQARIADADWADASGRLLISVFTPSGQKGSDQGEVYQVEVNTGQAQRIAGFPGFISFSPHATLAVYRTEEDKVYHVVSIPSGAQMDLPPKALFRSWLADGKQFIYELGDQYFLSASPGAAGETDVAATPLQVRLVWQGEQERQYLFASETGMLLFPQGEVYESARPHNEGWKDLENYPGLCEVAWVRQVAALPPATATAPWVSGPRQPPVYPPQSDLLYVRDHQLLRWNHTTGKIGVLVDPKKMYVTEASRKAAKLKNVQIQYQFFHSYSLSSDQNRLTFEVGNGQWVADYWLDLSTGKRSLISEIEARPVSVFPSISPDGNLVAFFDQGKVQTWDARTGEKVTRGSCSVDEQNGHYACMDPLLWSPDGTRLAWQDAAGLWVAKLSVQTPSLLLNNQPDSTPNRPRIFRAQAWAPSGKYLMYEARHYEGTDQGIVALESGATVAIPDTFEYSFPGALPTWIHEDQILSISLAYPTDVYHQSPYGRIWQLHSEGELELSEVGYFNLPAPSSFKPFGPAQLRDGQIGLGLVIRGDPNNEPSAPQVSAADEKQVGLYWLDLTRLIPRRVSGLLVEAIYDDYTDLKWSPDGSGVIAILNVKGTLVNYYVPVGSEQFYNLDSLLGDSASNFTWLQ